MNLNKKKQLIQSSVFRTRIKNMIEMYKIYNYEVKPVDYVTKKPVSFKMAMSGLKFLADPYQIDMHNYTKSVRDEE